MYAARSVKNVRSGRSKRAGFALEATLLLLVMFTIIVLAGLSAVTSLARSSDADYRGARASYAAEGGADDIMSQLDAKMQDGIINGSDIASLQTPALSGYRMTQTTATTGLPVSRTGYDLCRLGAHERQSISVVEQHDVPKSDHDTGQRVLESQGPQQSLGRNLYQ